MTAKELPRRAALKRLGMAVGIAYVAPAMTCLSTARAASSASEASNPTPPTPPSPPSGVDISKDEPDDLARDSCRRDGVESDHLIISQRDAERAERAVEAGYAKPLSEIWSGVVGGYNGQIIEIEFTGFRYRPRYRLKAISAAGRLETIIVSARTGAILNVVGC